MRALSLWLGSGAGSEENAVAAAECLLHRGGQRGALLVDGLRPVGAQSRERYAEQRLTRAQSLALFEQYDADPPQASLSYSHSRDGAGCLAAAVALAGGGGKVGVDLEWLRQPRGNLVALARRAFAPDEAALLAQAAQSMDDDSLWLLFAHLWTLREAAAKAFGLSLAAARARLQVQRVHWVAGQGEALGNSWQLRFDGQVQRNWTCQHWQPVPDLLLAALWRCADDAQAVQAAESEPDLWRADHRLQVRRAAWRLVADSAAELPKLSPPA